MCETKVVVVSISLILLVAAGFCIYQAHTENKVGHHIKIRGKGPGENEYNKFCLECYYLVDEDISGCNCTWLYGGKRCENTCGGTTLEFKNEKYEKFELKI